LSDIDFDEHETSAVLDVLNSKWLSMGPKTKEFEKHFGRYADVPFTLATANCTAALHMALISLGIGKGAEVILPSLTFVATSNAVLYTGAKPVLFGSSYGRMYLTLVFNLQVLFDRRNQAFYISVNS